MLTAVIVKWQCMFSR